MTIMTKCILREKLLLPLLLDTWLLSPIIKNGDVEPIESVVKRRTKALLSLQNSLGIFLYNNFSLFKHMEIKFEIVFFNICF